MILFRLSLDCLSLWLTLLSLGFRNRSLVFRRSANLSCALSLRSRLPRSIFALPSFLLGDLNHFWLRTSNVDHYRIAIIWLDNFSNVWLRFILAKDFMKQLVMAPPLILFLFNLNLLLGRIESRKFDHVCWCLLDHDFRDGCWQLKFSIINANNSLPGNFRHLLLDRVVEHLRIPLLLLIFAFIWFRCCLSLEVLSVDYHDLSLALDQLTMIVDPFLPLVRSLHYFDRSCMLLSESRLSSLDSLSYILAWLVFLFAIRPFWLFVDFDVLPLPTCIRLRASSSWFYSILRVSGRIPWVFLFSFLHPPVFLDNVSVVRPLFDLLWLSVWARDYFSFRAFWFRRGNYLPLE